MKSKVLLLTTIITLSLSVSSLKAQEKAAPDNNQFIAVVQTQTTGKNKQTHYKLTNNNSVPMDFSLYKQLNNGSWDVTHHLDLKAGQNYEDITGFTGYSGKYIVYSAPHSSYASFPDTSEIPGLQAGSAANPPALPPPPDPAPATTAPEKSAPANDVPPKPNVPRP